MKSSMLPWVKICVASLLASAVILLMPGQGSCTEEYARKTGQSCGACHLDPSGGGELTAAGKTYQESIRPAKTGEETGAGKRAFRLIIGYLHILTGVFWFGTILYVHLVLKPKYAAQGLPKGEMLIGVVSICIMAVTGIILTLFRVTSVDMLFHTRFGILLSIKITIFLFMSITAVLVVLVIGPRLRNKKGKQAVELKEALTLTELQQFDGREGRLACFAYNGRVYDATASRLWADGVHMGKHKAGTDLSEALKLAPHGEDKILAMREVAGILDEDEGTGMTAPQKVFYFMAYMNLIAVFSIIFIIALWRWW